MAEKRQFPKLPLKIRFYVAALSAAWDASRRSDGTINRRLLSFLLHKTRPNAKPVRGIRTADVPIDLSRNLWMRLFVPSPSSGRTFPVIVFFHGGGFAYLSADFWAYDAVCRRIARKTSTIVASVNYRLSPEHRFPSQYDDATDALRFLDGGAFAAADPSAAEMADLSNVFLAGDSAGGNIVHHAAVRWAEGKWRRVRLAGVVAIQPWFGGEERTDAEERMVSVPLVTVELTDWLWRAFLPEGEDREHPAANVFGPRAPALPERFPPAVVVVGGYDPLKDWQRRYYEGLRLRGVEARLVEFPEAIHSFYMFPELLDSGNLINLMKDFIESHRSPAVAVAVAAASGAPEGLEAAKYVV